jgi:pimeloyl-ACP methyl ester carboxylesterase
MIGRGVIPIMKRQPSRLALSFSARHRPRTDGGRCIAIFGEELAMEDIWFVESGHGTPLILLHGGLADHRAVLHWAAPLAEHHRVITPDLRGSGRSHFAGPLTWDLLADDIAALAARLGLSRAVIGGGSFGAGVAVRVALRHPALVAGLIVLSPAYGGDEVGLLPAQQAAMAAMHAAGRRAPTEGIAALYPLFDALPESIRARARTMVDSFDPASVAASTAFMASAIQPFARGADLAAITAPSLLVPGADPTHPPEVSDVYRRHLPRVTVREVATTWDASGYAEAIRAFIA